MTEVDEATVRASLQRLGNLAPGDFAAVARGQRALRERATPAELVVSLEAESRAKPGAARVVGF